MNVLTLAALASLVSPGQVPTTLPTTTGQVTPSVITSGPQTAAPTTTLHPAYDGSVLTTLCPQETAVAQREFLQSDHEFDGFVNPVSNPIFAKDPRANTWARMLYINNSFPGGHPFGGGTAQVWAVQVNVALTERLAFIADKDGFADINPRLAPGSSGWLNLAAGLKYTFIRDVENQFLLSGGFMYEVPSGENDVLQNHGNGHITPFIAWGKECGEHWHIIGNHGYSHGLDQTETSSFAYHSLHIDREIGGWFYPFVELNLFQYTRSGDRIPFVVGEGDGLLNLGTQGIKARQMFSAALGAKIKFSENLYAGAAYEFPLSNYRGILNDRLTFDLVLRY